MASYMNHRLSLTTYSSTRVFCISGTMIRSRNEAECDHLLASDNDARFRSVIRRLLSTDSVRPCTDADVLYELPIHCGIGANV